MKFTFSILLTLYLSILSAQTKDSTRVETKEDVTINKLKTEFAKYAQFVNNKKTDSILAVSDRITNICSANFSINDLALSERYYDFAAVQFSKFRDYEQMGSLFNAKGNDYLNVQFYSIALKYFKQSEAYYQKSPFPCLATSPTNNLGKIYYSIGDYKGAQRKFLQSMQYLKQCNGVLSEAVLKNETILRKMNLSLILLNEKKYQEAENEFSKLIATPGFEKDVSNYIRLLVYENFLTSKSELTGASNLQALEDQVLRLNVNALSIYEKNLYYEVLSYIYAFNGDKAKAYSNINLALQISEREKDQNAMAQNYNAMIFIGKKFADFDVVMQYQKKLIDLNEDVRASNVGRNVQEFSALYKLKDLEKEKMHFSAQNEINRSNLKLKEAENSRFKIIVGGLVFSVLIAIFLIQLYIKRSNLLASQKNTIELKNAALENIAKDLSLSNKTIRKTFSIISHDLRNPFQALLNYSSELADNYDKLDDDKKIFYINIMRRMSEENFNLTQSLLEWSLKQYQGFEIKKSEEDMHELVEDGMKALIGFTSFQKVKILNEVEKVNLHIDKKVILTILNNLLTNALKFASAGSDVLVTSKRADGTFNISIFNDEKTLTEERIAYIKTFLAAPSKTEEDYTIGFGLKIVKEMANLHDAKIEFNSENDRTEVTLILKM